MSMHSWVLTWALTHCVASHGLHSGLKHTRGR